MFKSVVDPPQPCRRSLEGIEHLGELLNRREQLREVQQERDQHADGDEVRPARVHADHRRAPDAEDDQDRDVADELSEGEVAGLEPLAADTCVAVAADEDREVLEALGLPGEIVSLTGTPLDALVEIGVHRRGDPGLAGGRRRRARCAGRRCR